MKKLDTPEKIQDFLDAFPSNLSRYSDSCSSPRMALRKGRAHCIEGAFIAATALWLHGRRPLLLDLKAKSPDFDHVIVPFKHNGYWGAISKSNHPVLRYRDPIYRTLRELALSYFHEYVLTSTGEKTLRSYSRPFSLKRFGIDWITSENIIHYQEFYLCGSPAMVKSAREKLETIRLILRLTKDLKQISLDEFVSLSEKIENISKQLL